MLLSLGILVASVFVSVESTSSFSQTKLHKYMNDEELRFYFGGETILTDYEIVDLPESLSSGRESVINGDEDEDYKDGKYVSFKVFDKQVKLNLYTNKLLISPHAKIVTKASNGTERMRRASDFHSFCHYLHIDSLSTAAISNCLPKEIQGMIFLPDDTLQILPLSQRLKFVLKRRDSTIETRKDEITFAKVPHLIKRSSFNNVSFENDFLRPSFRGEKLSMKKHDLNPTVELGLFFDEAFYKTFTSFFENDEVKMTNFILSYINGVQSLFYHNSLGRKIDFTIVHLELMEEQPINMPHASGERNDLIQSFCEYQKLLNPGDDQHPEHWDMAVYISALDFFAWDSQGRKNGATMGLATVSGVCNNDFNCIIVEFGSINQFGKPYPSSGYTAVYILAHEIGHNLGMPHDSTGNSCAKEGFVMSPTRGAQGETSWSPCSASILTKLE